MDTRFWWRNQKEKHCLKDLGIDGMIILKRILQKHAQTVLTGLIWLWVWTSGTLLRTQ
jgi:hypothetical protein